MTTERCGLTVYYDGACPLCRAEIGHYRRQAGAQEIRFLDASDEGTDLPPGLSRDAALGRFHVRAADGDLVSGAAAFRLVWQALPRWRPAARLAALPGVLPLLEAGYRLFLPVRPHVARLYGRLSGAVRSPR
jgi:predicted DCC family thiol-disulfide oxidoreductase YuxK